MKKVGIITMYRISNYGSAFQAYGLMKYINKLGYECTLINYLFPNKYHKKIQHSFSLKNIILPVYHFFLGNPYKKKEKKFEIFYKTHLKETKKTYNVSSEMKDCNNHFDIFITGSDQVWNYEKIGTDTSFFLDFVNDNKKRISYASSFSHKTIPNYYVKLYSSFLDKYNHIGVRETSGIKIVKQMIGKDAVCVLDPTFLLSKEEWDEISTYHEINIEKPYILVYVLSYAFNPYPYIEDVILKLHSETGLDVVAIGLANKSLRHISWLHRYIYASPADFLYLYSKATYVITTSFHGTVFSMIYQKPFIAVVPKNSDDNRICNILSLLKKEEHLVFIGDNIKNIKIPIFIRPENWESEINKSKKYLESALKY